MATIELNPLITDIRKKMGNVVFSKWKDINYVRSMAVPSNPKTEAQLAVRAAFSQLVSNWKQVNGILHRNWKEYAKNLNMTGFNAFIGKNYENQRAGLALELFNSMGEEKMYTFQTDTGSNAGEIQCTFSPGPLSEGRHAGFFTQKIGDGIALGDIAFHAGGENTSSPFTISGLEPGERYFVYAVVTDALYQEASRVSASVADTAVAGS